MKRLLIISYDFPPVGGVGVQRILKLIKYLPENGIEPIVLSNAHALGAPKPHDPTLLKADYLRNITIFRKGGERLARYHKYKSSGDKSLYPYVLYLGIKNIWFMDIFKEWFDSCRSNLKTIINDFNINCVLTTSPPHSVHFFGELIQTEFDVPWIMDLRDSMTVRVNRMLGIANRIQAHAEAHFEKRFVESAAHIITVSDPMKNNLADRNGVHLLSTISVLPNGYDPDDFIRDEHGETVSTPDKFTITYTGSLIGKITPTYFVDALRSLVHSGVIDGKDLIVRFAGPFNNETTECIRKLEKFTNLQLPGFLPHTDAIRMQKESSLLLLILPPGREEYAAEILTGKVFEYMAAGKPILALTPKGPVKDMIDRGFGYTAMPNDVTDIANTLRQIYKDWRSDRGLRYTPDCELLQRHSRKEQARNLAGIIENVRL